ncbi:S-adenosyl-L-methionine dependent tRNA/rRNA methyltransferase, SpoU, predicted [Pseudovibrio sp. FO-BEG1]|uniref:tRNA (cytidine(34)-2'-O)-methyltransferase n=2 Tax=Pseudovibrio TaxID=258255 RepID=A0A1I6Z8Z0_9HYPH|nr:MULTISPECIES: tRNA (cytidine(34)-2'-O)-methyltransferase [Pseudovibrio]AEV38955.1 S-adenosyl-L-methionine dependent tRNA/rRNA methyltransferase, SpoU, predicted [Pseudovibrio sp. FO-BEG1]EEA95554.1 rRNA Methylase [Pseudovibrio sp. JE062]QUS55017.1 tRNA (cytidine(34)-2'-O)-methyltransferase [Pseudovibrio brasiliensis]SFT59152.1 tRNA (cytidine/uridine-2'-O-)-methyltransferase [Pseudovibrio denitrificans]
MPDIALYQPDIPQNTGTLLRLAACMDVTVHLIEPAGFPLSDHALKRAGMDYIERAKLQRHMDWESFREWQLAEKRRLILMTTKGTRPYTQFAFKKDDLILMGRESSGVPEEIHQLADSRLLIPMKNGMRSLNMAVSTGMVLGEALRQTDCF